MTPEAAAEIRREALEVAADGRHAKRALKGAMGQIRLATQLLARYDERLDAFVRRVEEHTAEEAKHDEDHQQAAVAA